MSSDYMEALRRLLNLRRLLITKPDVNANEDQASVLASTAMHATPVYLSPWVESAVYEAAAQLPTDVSVVLADLPCEYGYVPLAGHIVHTGEPTGTVRLTGLMWRPIHVRREQGGEMLCVMCCWGDEARLDTADFGIDLIAWHTPIGEISPSADQAWEAQDVEPPPDWRERMIEIRRIAYALWAFMRERRATTVTHRGVDRALRKQAERSGWTHEPIVQVVELRASEPRPHDADGEHASVDWACRWAVRGHWHKYGDGTLRARWVAPYVKGPAGKPLRAATKLLAVVR